MKKQQKNLPPIRVQKDEIYVNKQCQPIQNYVIYAIMHCTTIIEQV